jgi:ribosomal protein S27AE
MRKSLSPNFCLRCDHYSVVIIYDHENNMFIAETNFCPECGHDLTIAKKRIRELKKRLKK